MLFLPSTSISNIKLNVQIVLSLAIFGIGLVLTVAQAFTSNEVINYVNFIYGFSCLFIGLLSMYSASKGYKFMMPVLLIGLYGLLTYLFFNHSDATMSSPVVLCGYLAIITLTSFKYHWAVSLGTAIVCSATAALRLYLINTALLDVVVGDNPIWLNNVIILSILVFICILTGYYGYEMNKFAAKLSSDNSSYLGTVISEHEKNAIVLKAIKTIGTIYQNHAEKIDDIIISNEAKLNPANEVNYDELLQIGNAVSEEIDELLLAINKNIESV